MSRACLRRLVDALLRRLASLSSPEVVDFVSDWGRDELEALSRPR